MHYKVLGRHRKVTCKTDLNHVAAIAGLELQEAYGKYGFCGEK